jgi:hypothetical protein
VTEASPTPPEEVDWDGVTGDMARLILAQGEAHLRGQLQVAADADRRAMTFASIFVTMATAVLGATVAFYNVKSDKAALIGGIAAVLCGVAAAVLCVWTARPQGFHLPGNHPRLWWPVRKNDLVATIGGETENYQDRIDYNDRVLSKNSTIFMIGAILGVTAPAVGTLAWFIATRLS